MTVCDSSLQRLEGLRKIKMRPVVTVCAMSLMYRVAARQGLSYEEHLGSLHLAIWKVPWNT